MVSLVVHLPISTHFTLYSPQSPQITQTADQAFNGLAIKGEWDGGEMVGINFRLPKLHILLGWMLEEYKRQSQSHNSLYIEEDDVRQLRTAASTSVSEEQEDEATLIGPSQTITGLRYIMITFSFTSRYGIHIRILACHWN